MFYNSDPVVLKGLSMNMLKKYFLFKTHSHSSYHLFNFLRAEIYYSFQHKRSLRKQYNVILSQQVIWIVDINTTNQFLSFSFEKYILSIFLAQVQVNLWKMVH